VIGDVRSAFRSVVVDSFNKRNGVQKRRGENDGGGLSVDVLRVEDIHSIASDGGIAGDPGASGARCRRRGADGAEADVRVARV